MDFSARNQLRVTGVSVRLGDIMAEVVMSLPDGQEIVSAITRSSVERLDIKPGDQVVAMVKATEVMVARS